MKALDTRYGRKCVLYTHATSKHSKILLQQLETTRAMFKLLKQEDIGYAMTFHTEKHLSS